jgi:flagellar biosynthesis/type III secretory pathway M-ring protein FliF/YscJ
VVKWIVLAVVLFALVVLALAVRPVLARLPRLRRAAVALQRRQGEAEALRAGAEALQERAEALQAQAAVAQERMALIKAKRGN